MSLEKSYQFYYVKLPYFNVTMYKFALYEILTLVQIEAKVVFLLYVQEVLTSLTYSKQPFSTLFYS